MIARFSVLIPFPLTLPIQPTFDNAEFVVESYKVKIYPPKKNPTHQADANVTVKIGQLPAEEKSIIQIDFMKGQFNRAVEVVCDPPFELISRVVNSLIKRISYVTFAPQLGRIELPMCDWRVDYLYDDETLLELQPGFVRSRWGRKTTVSCIAINEISWKKVLALPFDYSPMPWHPLLLEMSIPDLNPGVAVVLANTALEVFISYILNRLAASSSLPENLWKWINDRSNFQKDPSVGEQFDILLKVLLGRSLKDENELWKSFQNLRAARNNFVHEGQIDCGKSSDEENKLEAKRLAASATSIIEKIRQWLPQELQWLEPRNTSPLNVEHAIGILGATGGETSRIASAYNNVTVPRTH